MLGLTPHEWAAVLMCGSFAVVISAAVRERIKNGRSNGH
jgi:hypothetical protein